MNTEVLGGARKRKTPPIGGAGIQEQSNYAFSFRRNIPARPTKPVPIRVRLLGSGTTMFVSPLAIEVEPLKKPTPVLIVNWRVAPYTVPCPSQAPEMVPESV
jgi:hypothetical protein